MIADFSALPEQVVRDAVRSAFDSAGQRCSAARVLFVQEDVADRIIDMLAGAIQALDVGDPFDYATDIGPVIDEAAQDASRRTRSACSAKGASWSTCRCPTAAAPAPTSRRPPTRSSAWSMLDARGVRAHPARRALRARPLDKVVDAINATGFGLTLGLHSRIEAVADYVAEHARVGNLYVNRNQIGAVVGVQPFGGEGLSGTGPKAGGPNYLFAFATERVRTTDITATGGNVELLTGGTITGR